MIKVAASPGVQRFRLVGELDLVDVPSVRRALNLVKEVPEDVQLDLSELRYLSSQAHCCSRRSLATLREGGAFTSSSRQSPSYECWTCSKSKRSRLTWLSFAGRGAAQTGSVSTQGLENRARGRRQPRCSGPSTREATTQPTAIGSV